MPAGGPPVTPQTQWCFYMVGDNPTSDMEGVRAACRETRRPPSRPIAPCEPRLAALGAPPQRHTARTPPRRSPAQTEATSGSNRGLARFERQVRRANIYHRGSTTQWRGVLVRTGVYKEGDEVNGADVVVDGIAEAVDWILEQESSAQATPEPAAKKAKK